MSGWGKKNAYINNTFVEHVTPNLHDDAWCKLGCYIYFTPLFISGFVDIENGEHRYHGYPDRSLGEVFPHTYPGGDVNTVVSNKLDPPHLLPKPNCCSPMSSVREPSAAMNLSGMNFIGSGYFSSLCVIALKRWATLVLTVNARQRTICWRGRSCL